VNWDRKMTFRQDRFDKRQGLDSVTGQVLDMTRKGERM
jgi:hypothetical protein